MFYFWFSKISLFRPLEFKSDIFGFHVLSGSILECPIGGYTIVLHCIMWSCFIFVQIFKIEISGHVLTRIIRLCTTEQMLERLVMLNGSWCVLWKRFWEMLIYSAKHLLYLLLYRFKLWLWYSAVIQIMKYWNRNLKMPKKSTIVIIKNQWLRFPSVYYPSLKMQIDNQDDQYGNYLYKQITAFL